jgi:hypothetical protein
MVHKHGTTLQANGKWFRFEAAREVFIFERFVPITSPHSIRKFPWVTKKLNGLKNRELRAPRRMKKESERQ